MDEGKRHEQGMKTRRAVLGDAHVDRTLKNRTKFNAPFQDLITRYAWGEVWSRPGLPRKTRSLLTLSMLVALNREPEFRMHLKAALYSAYPAMKFRKFFCKLPFIAASRPLIPPSTPRKKCSNTSMQRNPNKRVCT